MFIDYLKQYVGNTQFVQAQTTYGAVVTERTNETSWFHVEK